MTFEQWVARYEKKTGERFYIPDDFQLAFDEDEGFFVFKIGDWQGRKWMEIQGVCVKRVQWIHDSVIDFVKKENLAGVVSRTKRNPKAYRKATGANMMDEGNGSFLVFWEVQNVPIQLTKV